jgi:hypothetical protein
LESVLTDSSASREPIEQVRTSHTTPDRPGSWYVGAENPGTAEAIHARLVSLLAGDTGVLVHGKVYSDRITDLPTPVLLVARDDTTDWRSLSTPTPSEIRPGGGGGKKVPVAIGLAIAAIIATAIVLYFLSRK